MGYAEGTEVSVEKSKAEIETILRKYGADSFASGWEGNLSVIKFRKEGKFIRFMLPLPDPKAKEFTHYRHSSGNLKPRKDTHSYNAWEQECRSRWRALRMSIYAKVEAVRIGITSFEEEFLAHFVLPNGKTVAEEALPKIERAYKTGLMPKSLLGLPAPTRADVIDVAVGED